MAGERRPLSEEEIGNIRAVTAARETGTHYDVLGIRADAPDDAIEAAFHAFARSWHPDRFYSRDTGDLGSEIEENFVAATRAFRALREPLKRAAYHREKGIVVPARPPSDSPRTAAPAGGPRASAEAPTPDTTTSRDASVYQARLQRPAVKPAPPPPRPPKPKASPAFDRLRQQVAEQLARARQYYLAGKEDYDGGRYSRAEASLYLAVKFDPKNAEYAELHEKAVRRAREGRAKGFILQAEQEESYQRVKEAIAAYHEAIACDPPDGLAWFRLGMLLKNQESDARSAVQHLRKAVQKEPNKLQYRMALAEVYELHGLAANALREANAAIGIDPKNEAAKAMAKRLKR